MFAIYLNAKLPQFISWGPDPFAWKCDALTLNWNDFYGYCFPPFSLWPTILQKLTCEGGKLLAIALEWPSQIWFTDLLSRTTAGPLRLRKSCKLYLPWQPHKPHPIQNRLKLFAATLEVPPP